jgi:hypothetical protein
MKSTGKHLFLMLLSALLLTACAVRPVPLNEGAENVKVVEAAALPGTPLINCEFKGEILSHYILPYAPKDTMPTDNEIRVLKNKALGLGANFVVIYKNGIVMSGNNEYNHVMMSNAYMCYSGALIQSSALQTFS